MAGDHTFLGITRAEVVDHNLQLARPVLTPTVLIIGCTDNPNAPLEDPYRIEGSADIAKFDLSSGNPSEISKAIMEAQAGGADNIEVFVLSDGSGTRWSSLSNQNRYNALDRAYNLLENHACKIVVPVGAYVDASGLSSNQNFAYQLANHCFWGTRQFTSRMGVIGVSPPTSTIAPTGVPTLAEMSSWVTALTSFDTSGLQGAAFSEYDGVTDSDSDNIPDTYAF